uniref:Uncharacterized protein ycf41 n=1 Tax=Kryptoperidinium foliaceum TaxID=160619 RepID=D7PJA6_9DINO|nr:hypothetical protein KrfoC_p011 [Kryptoperidinium foliaceum]ADI40306.1 conserved hypothetical protein [Kryptoperidinium foliaceum]
MVNTNYFSGIVKILETPKEYQINPRSQVTWVRVELPQKRKSCLVILLIWGNLGQEVKKFYNANDYILIEGYTSIRSKSLLSFPPNNLKQVFITVSKVYPMVLNSNRLSAKI